MMLSLLRDAVMRDSAEPDIVKAAEELKNSQ